MSDSDACLALRSTRGESRSSQEILTSCEAQDLVGRDFCENYGWTIVDDTHHDSGGSSETLVRPSLPQMLQDIEAGEIDAVGIYRLARLTRRVRDFARLMPEFEKHDVDHRFVLKESTTRREHIFV